MKRMKHIAQIVVVSVLLAGCGGTPAAVQPPAPTVQRPTSAPPTPAATTTPAALTEPAVMASLRASGLPITDIVAFTSETDPNKLLGRPNQYVVKVSWKDSRAPELGPFSRDPTLEVFPAAPAMAAWRQYIDGITSAGPLFAQYVYANDRRLAMVRLPRELSPDHARDYERWLAGL